MLKRPKLKPNFCAQSVLNQGVTLLSERGSVVLGNHIYQSLFPLLDGTRTIDEVLDALPEQVSATHIYYGLMELEHQGYLIEDQPSLPESLDLFCSHLGIDPVGASNRLQQKKVRIYSVGDVIPPSIVHGLQDALLSLHVHVLEGGEGNDASDSDLEVIVTHDYLQADLAAINQRNLDRRRPWLLVKPVGTILWIGPLIYPGQTGCWDCLSQRLRENRPIESFIQRHNSQTSLVDMPLSTLPSIVQNGLSMTATEILKWIVQGHNKALEGQLMTFDTLTLKTQYHRLVKRPQCKSCGILPTKHRKPKPIIIGHRKKRFTVDGGHRCVTPQETLKRYRHHISPITGVVRDLSKLSQDLTGFTSTYCAKHHFVSAFDDLKGLAQNLGGRSAGKGKTDAQAKASGFCEAIERYSGVFQGDEIRIQGSYQSLGDLAIHPNECMGFSDDQYRDRKFWNAQCESPFQYVPVRFDEEKQIDWTPIWSMTHGGFKYLPTAYCYFGYPKSLQSGCWADTNGCAAGNTIEEAILQGFMELVERDSIAIWWYNQISRPGVDLSSFGDPYFQTLLDFYHSLQRELWVVDITGDLNIPTFAAISRRYSPGNNHLNETTEDIVLGFGTHFDAKLAVQRALTEVNQTLPAVMQANPDGSTQYATSADPSVLEWWQTATVANQPYLLPDHHQPTRRLEDYPIVNHNDLFDDINLCQNRIEQKGMELLVLDQTRPDIGLRVVKVVVPGMRHFWKRLDQGRLYDVPVQLGWLKQPKPETELNSIPMWL